MPILDSQLIYLRIWYFIGFRADPRLTRYFLLQLLSASGWVLIIAVPLQQWVCLQTNQYTKKATNPLNQSKVCNGSKWMDRQKDKHMAGWEDQRMDGWSARLQTRISFLIIITIQRLSVEGNTFCKHEEDNIVGRQISIISILDDLRITCSSDEIWNVWMTGRVWIFEIQSIASNNLNAERYSCRYLMLQNDHMYKLLDDTTTHTDTRTYHITHRHTPELLINS